MSWTSHRWLRTFSHGVQCAPLAADTLTFLQIAMYTSWRWIYWVLIIFIGVCWLLGLFFLKETYSPVLLARRAKEMRKETGDDSIMTEQERNKRPISDIVQEALLRPLGMSLPFAQRSSLETDLFFSPSHALHGADHDLLLWIPLPHLRSPLRVRAFQNRLLGTA